MAFLQNLPVQGGFSRSTANLLDGTRWDRSIPTAGLPQPDAATSVLNQGAGSSNEVIPLGNGMYQEMQQAAERMPSEIGLDDKSLDSVSLISGAQGNQYAHGAFGNPDESAYNR